MADDKIPEKQRGRKFPRNDLTAHYVRSILDYNLLSGDLRWRWRADCPAKWNITFAGKIAGTLNPDGYRRVCINYHIYLAHRLIWLIMTGRWPEPEVDHKNTKRDDNRWDNLRQATVAQNTNNTGLRSTNISGFKGVYLHQGRWVAQISSGGKQRYLGGFDTPQEAHRAYCEAADKFHGEFANHG
jgi:hypothetical protein